MSASTVTFTLFQREKELTRKLQDVERQYNSSAVEERMLEMQTKERQEREKQREFLDSYYEERMKVGENPACELYGGREAEFILQISKMS